MESACRERSPPNAKDRALATLAHDIRSPLGAIDSYCSNLEDGIYGSVTDRQRHALGRVRMSGQHLLSLLDSVMDMARLTAGVMPVPLEPMHSLLVAREAVDILAPAALAKCQTLRVDAGADFVVVGPARVRQVRERRRQCREVHTRRCTITLATRLTPPMGLMGRDPRHRYRTGIAAASGRRSSSRTIAARSGIAPGRWPWPRDLARAGRPNGRGARASKRGRRRILVRAATPPSVVARR